MQDHSTRTVRVGTSRPGKTIKSPQNQRPPDFTRTRGAGILLHITSLPSAFGAGDLGPEAYRFVEFLGRNGQGYWQILPVTPVAMEQGYSPYSATSSMAGNEWLISPELLEEDGLLAADDLLPHRAPVAAKADYALAEKVREELFGKAYENFKLRDQASFESFCDRQAYWLDDYALYRVLKEHFADKPWFEWPDIYKHRDLKALLSFGDKHSERITEVKWLQFLFYSQWHALRKHCTRHQVKLLGDLPFYMSYDSADVWSRREIFKVDDDGAMEGVSGVPPDYFNDDGQLWGMPVYRWDVLSDQRYDWWLKRIKKNLEQVDLLRLDHFRAFASYWEVPAGEKTAKKGTWQPGPGAVFFEILRDSLGSLPFVAEDLGDITPDVYRLRDQFGFPGMKVLQFAFGKKMPQSDHIPHRFGRNFIAYTGTHDNNTTRGWFANDLSETFKTQLEQYAGCKVTEENVHQVLTRMAYASVAAVAIIPMQDVLGLDENSRMNVPASTSGNWGWRLIPEMANAINEKMMKQWTRLYAR